MKNPLTQEPPPSHPKDHTVGPMRVTSQVLRLPHAHLKIVFWVQGQSPPKHPHKNSTSLMAMEKFPEKDTGLTVTVDTGYGFTSRRSIPGASRGFPKEQVLPGIDRGAPG
jgi:hypothetical protein